jgi:hypothetical protein
MHGWMDEEGLVLTPMGRRRRASSRRPCPRRLAHTRSR